MRGALAPFIVRRTRRFGDDRAAVLAFEMIEVFEFVARLRSLHGDAAERTRTDGGAVMRIQALALDEGDGRAQ